jgi:hypothetical protein
MLPRTKLRELRKRGLPDYYACGGERLRRSRSERNAARPGDAGSLEEICSAIEHTGKMKEPTTASSRIAHPRQVRKRRDRGVRPTENGWRRG